MMEAAKAVFSLPLMDHWRRTSYKFSTKCNNSSIWEQHSQIRVLATGLSCLPVPFL